MKRYFIVADDITGANDTGVQLTRRGLNTVVTVTPDGVCDDANSYVLDCESRSLNKTDAYNKVREQLGKINLSGFDCVIKKVDSTIRGNIAQEVLAVDEAVKSELVIFIPALPDLARTTVNAVHMLNGVRITQTEISKDPKKPVLNDNLVEVLAEVYKESIGAISLDDIRNGSVNFDEHRVYVADSVTNADMETVVRKALATGKKILWVGSAGIADNLLEVESETVPVMAVVASISETTRTQIKYAEDKGTKLVKVPAYTLVKDRNYKKYTDLAVEYLSRKEDIILLSTSSYDRAEMEASEKAGVEAGLSVDEMSGFIQEILGEIADSILKQVKVAGVFLTGGDTAIGFFKQMGVKGCKIESEVMIGIPSMKIIGGCADGIKLITKAGAFGGPDAIAYAMRKLKER